MHHAYPVDNLLTEYPLYERVRGLIKAENQEK